MKNISIIFISLLFLLKPAGVFAQTSNTSPAADFYKLSFMSISGEKIDFSSLKGKKVLIVNTASKCGYTPQFSELEELNKKYGNKLIILGFPSNDFMNQDPGSNEEILSFCKENYGVTFTMMEKSSVKGKDRNPVYLWLTEKSLNGWNETQPGWNFNKYLIDESGNLIAHFSSKVKPLSEDIISKL
ncbi:MAG: glutathione peroxidase [Bacteroidales bacterium]|jgi:glutathione peroxidase|nr:glutathione peroxidase [Bacteroidales bacterium]MDD3272516.1 glutathione peroxidase [Bacteroidales bacterium]MDD4057820.1 glutathione peroxidase [Bacteroidales bacterium]